MAIRVFALGCLLSLLSACTHPFTRIQPPSVSIAGIELIEAKVLEQRYRLQLRIQNPNGQALPISGMRYRLFLNGIEFAHGVSSQAVHIPAYEERLVDVELVSTIGAVVEQLSHWPRPSDEALRYRLAGEAEVSRRLAPVGFEYHGAIPLQTRLTPP